MTRENNGIVPVSVIIPCYCCSDTIERAIQSVATQISKPSEVILVDDASPDEGKTLAKLHTLQNKYGDIFDIKIIALEVNGGPGAARNAAWNLGSQPYAAFLDADDAWFPEKLHIQYEWMSAHSDVILSGHLCTNPEKASSKETSKGIVATQINRLSVLLRNPFSMPSVMLKSELPFRFPAGESFAEDFFLWQQIVCAGHPVVRLEVVMACLHKAVYGEAGLSSRLWKMERSELGNYARLRRQGCMGAVTMALLIIYSLVKYARRLLVVKLRRWKS